MQRKAIREKAHRLVRQFSTHDPFTLCKSLEIPLYFDYLGENVMGYNTYIKRVPSIIINTDMSTIDQINTCAHELGHNRCGHGDNTDFLKRNSLVTKKIGVEYEANCFLCDLILDGANISDFRTHSELLSYYGIPSWANRSVDWNFLVEECSNYY